METLQSLDAALFRFINSGIKNGLFDWLLPFFNSNAAFVPVLILLGAGLTLKGGVRGRLFVCFLLLTFVIGDPLIVNSLKNFIDRPRPFTTLADFHLLVGKTDNPSMPSGHAANWFAAATVAFIYYRWSLWFMLPLACIEAFSRMYLGVHYPSDVLVGSLLGIAYALLIVGGTDLVWRTQGRRWFPLWWAELPSLVRPAGPPTSSLAGESQTDSLSANSTVSPATTALRRESSSLTSDLNQHWLRLSYVLVGAILVGHLIYLACHKIQLSEDEAYQWLWSKHLDLSYFSKPPLIAYTQFLGTSLWGDNEFGVRFFSPVLGAVASFLIVRFLAREASGFVAALSVLASTAAPLLMVGGTLLTIDSLSVVFWVAAMVSGWRAVQRNSTVAWLWTGVWMGLGFLGKYIALFQWVCWAVFFVLWPPARAQLRRPGPYLALLVNALFLTPVLLWNAEHHWITMTHLATRGGLDRSWQPSLRFLWDFLAAEAVLLNPVFMIGMVWAAIAFWKRQRSHPVWVYLFSMGGPLFLFYFLYTFRARVQPNWIAPAVLPLFCLMCLYWDERWRRGTKAVKHLLLLALTLGWIVVVPLHDTRLIAKAAGTPLPVSLDPLTRVLGWKEMARAVNEARTNLLAEGKPVFTIASHYGTTSLLSFYTPAARARVPRDPLVYYISTDEPKNQFYFWPGYKMRKGQNAIFVGPVDRPEQPPPLSLHQEFASVTDLGMRDIVFKGRVMHRVQLFACRELR